MEVRTVSASYYRKTDGLQLDRNPELPAKSVPRNGELGAFQASCFKKPKGPKCDLSTWQVSSLGACTTFIVCTTYQHPVKALVQSSSNRNHVGSRWGFCYKAVRLHISSWGHSSCTHKDPWAGERARSQNA